MKVKKDIRFGLAVVLFLLGMSRCTSDPLQIDVSEVQVKLELKRLDSGVFASDWNNPQIANTALLNQFGDYYTFYGQFILNNQLDVSDPRFAQYIQGFATDQTMRAFYQATDSIFGGPLMQPYLKKLHLAFKHYHYYFPKEPIPTLMTYQSGFNYKIVPNDTLLGIGLEWYIGADHLLVKRLSPQVFPNYEKEKMKPEFLVVDAIKGFLKVKYQERLVMDNLLSTLIFYGKIMYLTEAMLPEEDKSTLMNYSDDELDWCISNETKIWTYLAENNLLFENSMLEITKWVNDGPFTNGLPQESPSRVGIWLGWQMIQQYMHKNPEVTLTELIEMDQSALILSQYKPKK